MGDEAEKIDSDKAALKTVRRARKAGGADTCPSCRLDVPFVMYPRISLGNMDAVPLVCSNCGFISLHSIDQMTFQDILDTAKSPGERHG